MEWGGGGKKERERGRVRDTFFHSILAEKPRDRFQKRRACIREWKIKKLDGLGQEEVCRMKRIVFMPEVNQIYLMIFNTENR